MAELQIYAGKCCLVAWLLDDHLPYGMIFMNGRVVTTVAIATLYVSLLL
jgi:hypothetical protein